MHFKKVIIEGFKTYRNKTVLCLELGLNVISMAWRNGAGKTNLICGNSSGFRETTAYVEIIFDNGIDEDKNEVKLRREITWTKDVYLLNGHIILKHHLEHTLQFSGFLKVDPCYIIKQGQISSLAMLSNEKRLELLIEITGASLWKEIRSKNEPLLKGMESKITELKKLRKETEDNLTRFAEDKIQYQKWSEAKRLLNDAQAEDQTLAEAERRFKLYQSELRAAQGRLKYLAEIAQDLTLQHSMLEFELAGKRERSVNNNKEKLNEELLRIETEIAEKNHECLVVSNDYDTIQLRQQLFVKLEREALFASIEERNDWINEEQRKPNRLILQEEKEMQNINEDMKDEELKAKNLETVIAVIEVEKLATPNSVKMLNQRKQEIILEQSELWRKECDVRDHWKQAYDKLAGFGCQIEQTQVFEGIEVVLDKMNKEGQVTLVFEIASQYRGLLIDQFTCADEVCCAIDAVAGNRLGYCSHTLLEMVRRNSVLKGGYHSIANSGSKIYFECKKAKQVEQTVGLPEGSGKHGGELSISRQALERKLAITRKLMMSLEANRTKVEM
ncbi:structural maintence of chromosome protein 3 [Daphnia sinensis]|uniref:Structural maintence of chromosome protein 3 n=1 Tax=Daphnia sinensis TaxID=1820382 RepID=A0AAD5L4R5_9CRUS|nr:structural maintence of chromosome protein 3 [Daphnia sinensis]